MPEHICNEHKEQRHRIDALERAFDRCKEENRCSIRKLEVDMIDIRNQSKVTIALITVFGGIISSGLTLAGVIAVPIIQGWPGI